MKLAVKPLFVCTSYTVPHFETEAWGISEMAHSLEKGSGIYI